METVGNGNFSTAIESADFFLRSDTVFRSAERYRKSLVERSLPYKEVLRSRGLRGVNTRKQHNQNKRF